MTRIGVDMGVGLLLMHRMGLWKRLRAAPLSKAQWLGSRTASCALIGLIVFAVVYAVAMAFFGVRISSSVPGFVAVLVAFALLTSSFGLMIAALGRTPDATRGLAILATLLMVMLGGAWVPSFTFPPWLQTVSMWMPTHWAVDGLDAMIWRGLPGRCRTRCCPWRHCWASRSRSRRWRWRAASGRSKARAGSMSWACYLSVPASVWPACGLLQIGDFKARCQIPACCQRQEPAGAACPGPSPTAAVQSGAG
jgi:hypothetical protein